MWPPHNALRLPVATIFPTPTPPATHPTPPCQCTTLNNYHEKLIRYHWLQHCSMRLHFNSAIVWLWLLDGTMYERPPPPSPLSPTPPMFNPTPTEPSSRPPKVTPVTSLHPLPVFHQDATVQTQAQHIIMSSMWRYMKTQHAACGPQHPPFSRKRSSILPC